MANPLTLPKSLSCIHNLLSTKFRKEINNQFDYQNPYYEWERRIRFVVGKDAAHYSLLKNRLFFTLVVLTLIGIIYYDNKLKQKKKERKLDRERYEKKSDFYF